MWLCTPAFFLALKKSVILGRSWPLAAASLFTSPINGGIFGKFYEPIVVLKNNQLDRLFFIWISGYPSL
jgi:hypothetical protein